MEIAESLNLSLKSFISASFSTSLFASAFSIVEIFCNGHERGRREIRILMGSIEKIYYGPKIQCGLGRYTVAGSNYGFALEVIMPWDNL